MTSNNEIIKNLENQYLIDTNEKILKRHKKLTGEQVWIGTTDTFDDIIPHVDSVGNSGDRKADLIEKATNLLAKITHCQPFEDGNRRTGIVSATKFLQDNGYDLDIESGQANLDIREMLKEIKMHSHTLHVETMNKMYFYISKRIKPYEPTG